MLRYLDVCAGISASTVAWKPLGWQAAAYSEIEAAPRAILAYHYPNTPLHGDFTTIRGDEYRAIDLLVGGTPCQDFSVAGLRAGLDGDRGNLNHGHGHLIAHSLRGEGFDASEDGTGRGTPLVPVPFDTTQITSPANRSNPKAGDPCHPLAAGMHPPAIAFTSIAFTSKDHGRDAGFVAPTLRAMQGAYPNAGGQVAIAYAASDYQTGAYEAVDSAGSPTTSQDRTRSAPIVGSSAVRRLTPRECERLQGFPDDYTLVPYRKGMMADGTRYKALGNSMAIPVMRWIGERISMVETLDLAAQVDAA
jgi:site-specific DNA-cytosine methylase